MHPLLKPSDRIALVGVIDPDANAAGTLLTTWVPAALYSGFMAIVLAGDLGVNGTIDAKLRQATDAAGTGAKDVTAKAITQLTQAGTDRSNKRAIINLESEDLDHNNGFTYVALSMTGAIATSDSAGLLFGIDPKYPVTNSDTANGVIEVVG